MLLKICGLTRAEDMAAAEQAGADYAGMILVPGTPRFVPRERISVLMVAARCKKIFVVRNMPPDELERTRRNLLKYCELDTYAMVKVWEKLCQAVT